MIPTERHATVFAALDAFAPGSTFGLVNNHAPMPLLNRIAQTWPDRFELAVLRDGPEAWQVAIARRATGEGWNMHHDEVRTMQLDRTEGGFQIDGVDLAPLRGIPAAEVQHRMRAGQITSLCEERLGDDRCRHRITFRHGTTRVRLTVNDTGAVLLRTRTTVAPRPDARPDTAG